MDQPIQALRNKASAKVEVVFGKPNQLRIEMEFRGRMEDIELWTTPTVKLTVVFKESTKATVERLMIFLRHPEYFFHNWTKKSAALIDKQLTVTAQCNDARSHMYYQDT